MSLENTAVTPAPNPAPQGGGESHLLANVVRVTTRETWREK